MKKTTRTTAPQVGDAVTHHGSRRRQPPASKSASCASLPRTELLGRLYQPTKSREERLLELTPTNNKGPGNNGALVDSTLQGTQE
eukprot:7728312-Pyramimonas_sp.AAC.1